MSLNVPPRRLRRAFRLRRIKEMLPAGATIAEIAEACRVTEKTVDRDIAEWKESGGFEEWLLQEFFRLHNKLKDTHKELAYRTIAGLLERTLKQKVEAEGQVKIVVEMHGLEDQRVPPARG